LIVGHGPHIGEIAYVDPLEYPSNRIELIEACITANPEVLVGI
jgi:hypothetical protein